MKYIIGIDEVGRGPIAGPVVVCACALLVETEVLHFFPQSKLKDSKKLSEKIRNEIIEKLTPLTESQQVVFGIGEVSAERIDEIGISPAIKEAMGQALASIHAQGVPKNSFVFLDGSLSLPQEYAQETIIKGDEKVQEIALASIFAKVYRDRLMTKVAEMYPEYGFENHVGYGTKAHYAAIDKKGLTPLHRKSFLKKVLG